MKNLKIYGNLNINYHVDVPIIKTHKDRIIFLAKLQNRNLVPCNIKGEIKFGKKE